MDSLLSQDFGEYFRFIVTVISGAAAFIWANRRDALDLKELEVLGGLRSSYEKAEDKSPVKYIDDRVIEILYKPDDYNRAKHIGWGISLGFFALVFVTSLAVAVQVPGGLISPIFSENVWIVTAFVVAAIAGVMISVSLSVVRKERDKKKRQNRPRF